MNLSNHTVLITGGSSGIGLGLAEAFHKAGSTVIICGRDFNKLAETSDRLEGLTAIPCDVGNARQREVLAGVVLAAFPKLDVLVNNAGIQRYLDLKKGYTDLKAGEDEVEINFSSYLELTALFINHLLAQPSATIINVSSALGLMPMVTMPVYCATKAAIHTYTLVLRQQLKDTGVKVVEVLPPMVDTNLNEAGRAASRSLYRGIRLAEYMPGLLRGLENDAEMIFHEAEDDLMSQPRAESENRLLNPRW